ncbi:MAG: deoxynucleoside kinase [Anaerolineae bacterium]|nr:deoxynucleoside kinase [Anaerolineae bacterium]MDW8102420.1 deoxynucleoside kinase [Anaerolineae bacterium]
MRGIYIAIEGPIGVGKTALARLIQPYFNAQLLLEVFEENPFLEKFYQDRERYAFQTELFFLLNRYHQQQEIVSDALTRGNLISDYTFVKNKLFASLNLKGEELNLYEQLYRILSQKIIVPDLICLLQASTDVLMERIAFRDRPYERNMDRDYIHRLRVAYDEFFSSYDEAPVLRIETDELNFIRKREDLELVVGMINSALKHKTLEKPPPFPLEGGK